MHPKPYHPRNPLLKCGAVVLSALQVFAGVPQTAFAQTANAAPAATPAAKTDASSHTRTPIKHVIVIIGENRTFDHVFATYKPKRGESVDNLLSKRIINEDGTPAPNFSLAAQYSAEDTHRDGYEVSPMEKVALLQTAHTTRRRSYQTIHSISRCRKSCRKRSARRYLLHLPHHRRHRSHSWNP